MHSKNTAVANGINFIVVCAPGEGRARQWGMEFAGLLGGDFIDIEKFPSTIKANAAQQHISDTILVAFASNLAAVDAEIGEDAAKIVLVESPSAFICRELQCESGFTLERIEQWLVETRRALDFFHRTSDRCGLLLTHEDIQKRPEDCLVALREMGIELPNLPRLDSVYTDPIVNLLADLIVERQTQCRSQYETILEASSLAHDPEENQANIDDSIHAVSVFLHEQSNTRRGCQVSIGEELNSTRNELELARLQIDQFLEELGDGSSKNTELDLALLQLHQIQDEFDSNYQKYLDECGKSEQVLSRVGDVINIDTLRVLRLAGKIQSGGVLG